MRFEYSRDVQPLNVRVTLELYEYELKNAFTMEHPNEALFYQTFSPAWETRSVPEQLRFLARLVELSQMARQLNLTADNPTSKE